MWIIFWWEIFHKKRVAPRSMKKFVFLSFDSISSLHSSLQKEHKKRQKKFFLLFITMLQKFSNAKQLVECWMKKATFEAKAEKCELFSDGKILSDEDEWDFSALVMGGWEKKKYIKKKKKRHKSNIKRLKILNLLNCKICRVIYNNENGEKRRWAYFSTIFEWEKEGKAIKFISWFYNTRKYLFPYYFILGKK